MVRAVTKPQPLDQLLACPETHQPLRRATSDELAQIAAAIRERRARRHDGGALPASIDGAYVSGDGRWVYPDDGLPKLLIDERIELE
jgi:uncharacterized protein YbaR (Trm112 family)